MSNFFVLSTDSLTTDQEKNLAALIGRTFAWWHWLPNFWLLRDDQEVWNVDAIREQFAGIAPNARCIILRVDPIEWTGRVRPDSAGNKMEDWVNSYWRKS